MTNWNDVCCVCTVKTSICRLPCSHHFCEDCSKSWLPKKRSCPICRTKTSHIHLVNGRIVPVSVLSGTLDETRNWISDFLGSDIVEPIENDNEDKILRRITKTMKREEKVSKLGSESSEVATLWDQFQSRSFLLGDEECPHPKDMMLTDQENTDMCTICGKTWTKESTLESVFTASAGSESTDTRTDTGRVKKKKKKKKKNFQSQEFCINMW